MISKFNRDTGWLGTGVLAILVFAALVIAIQEHPPRAMSTERDFLPEADCATVGSVVEKSPNPNRKMTHGPESGVDRAFTEASLQAIASSQMQPPASTPISVPAFLPERKS